MSKGAIAGPPTIERLERALLVMAYIVDRYGPVYMPLFEKIEQELIELRKQHESATLRALRVLEQYRNAGQSALEDGP